MKKKLGIFITLGVVLALALTVLILYLIPVNYMPALKNPDQIRIYQSSTQKGIYQATDDTQKDIYNNLLNKYNQAFSQSLLSAIFTGQTATAVQGNGQLTPVEKTFDGLQFVLNYSEGQDLVVYGYKQSVKITDVYIQLTQTYGYTKTDVYFKQIGTEKTYYQFTTYSNQGILYDAINDLEFPS